MESAICKTENANPRGLCHGLVETTSTPIIDLDFGVLELDLRLERHDLLAVGVVLGVELAAARVKLCDLAVLALHLEQVALVDRRQLRVHLPLLLVEPVQHLVHLAQLLVPAVARASAGARGSALLETALVAAAALDGALPPLRRVLLAHVVASTCLGRARSVSRLKARDACVHLLVLRARVLPEFAPLHARPLPRIAVTLHRLPLIALVLRGRRCGDRRGDRARRLF